jgi:hypothetical protein
VNVLILVVCRVKINVKMNSVKFLQGFNFSQLSLTEKTEIKNSDRPALDLLTSQPSPSRI